MLLYKEFRLSNVDFRALMSARGNIIKVNRIWDKICSSLNIDKSSIYLCQGHEKRLFIARPLPMILPLPKKDV